MSTALIPISSTPGRPSVIVTKECSHYISVRDEWHRGEMKRLKQRMYDLHPDRRWFTMRTLSNGDSTSSTAKRKLREPQSSQPFLNAKRQLDWFVKQEIIYYRTLGLSLPDEENQIYVPQETSTPPKLLTAGKWNRGGHPR